MTLRLADFSRERQETLFGKKVEKKKPKVNVGEETFAAQCRLYRLPTVHPQYQYAKTLGRKFSADFAFVEYQVLVEIQGGVWFPGGGAHSRPENIDRDIEKQQYAARLGFLVVPVTPKQVRSKHAIDLVSRILYSQGWRATS